MKEESDMNLDIAALDAPLGAEIRGLDISKALSGDEVAALRQAWINHSVLLFRGQGLNDTQLLAFTRCFGEPEFPPSKLLNYSQGSGQKDEVPLEINVISNVEDDGKPIGKLGSGEAAWHTDSAYVARPPAASVLHALEIPARGGNTSFLDMYAALDALPADLRARIEGRSLKHDPSFTSAGDLRPDYEAVADPSQNPGPTHPIVRTHPESGRKALFLGRRLNAYIVGLPVAESEALLDRIWEITLQRDFIYEHIWRVGDVLMWDNRCVMHRREAFDDNARRIMHRSQLQGEIPA